MNGDAYEMKGHAYRLLGLGYESLNCFQAAIKFNPESHTAQTSLAEAYSW